MMDALGTDKQMYDAERYAARRDGRSERYAYNKAWRAAHPESEREYDRRYNIRRKYGLAVAEYDDLVGRGCEVCGTLERRICVDHDHDTGTVRGALCANCNSGIGLLGDDPNMLLAAVAYLISHEDVPCIPTSA